MTISYIEQNRRKGLHAVGGNYRREGSDIQIMTRIREQVLDYHRKLVLEWGNVNLGDLRNKLVTFVGNYQWNDLPFGGYSVEEFVDEYIMKEKPVRGELRPLAESDIVVPESIVVPEVAVPEVVVENTPKESLPEVVVTVDDVSTRQIEETMYKRRGRPPGSKNKPKEVVVDG